jgi:hypothetical protein
MVPYQAWYRVKPDVSHVRIFGLPCFVNILKKIHGGKLEETSVKCRMLGYWADKTKGWRSEDISKPPGNVLASRDVRFLEDERSTKLAVFNDASNPPMQTELEELLPVKVSPSIGSATSTTASDDNSDSSDDEPRFKPDPKFIPLPKSPPPSLPPEVEPEPAPLPLPKISKWASLPPREPSHRQRNLAALARVGEPVIMFIAACKKHFVYLVQDVLPEPRTYKQAMKSENTEGWQEAIDAELEQLKETGTFEWIQRLPAGRSAIGSHFVFKVKTDGNGDIKKLKARLVAKGFSQIPGEDFTFTFSSVAKFATLRAMIALAAREDWELNLIDVVGAFLQGDLDEEIYMEVPDGAKEDSRDGWFWRLRQPLYGLKQAGSQWKEKLKATMLKLGFEKSQADDCLFILRDAVFHKITDKGEL